MSQNTVSLPFARGIFLCVMVSVLLPVAASPSPTSAVSLTGRVMSGNSPIANAHVTLYRARSNQNKEIVTLGDTRTDTEGYFEISYDAPSGSRAVLYLIAKNGTPQPATQEAVQSQPPIRLLSVLGVAPFPSDVVVNERTTVASAFALAQFLVKQKIAGSYPGMQNAAATVRNLVDLSTGDVGHVLGTAPNGDVTMTMRAFNSMANLLAVCVNNASQCSNLFTLATPSGGPVPRNTLQAILNIAHNPAQNAGALFTLSRSVSPEPYQPALARSPNAWTLAIKYVGNGQEFDGPGNLAIDKDGNAWITNNYVYHSDHLVPACGGKTVIKLTPTGEDAPGAPYTGGGVDGAGFGITIDPQENVWIGNFGFKGLGCQDVPAANSVSKFSSSGGAISPLEGYTNGPISSPQGTVSDAAGNIWIANCGNNTITQYPGGDHTQSKVFVPNKLSSPFDIAIDAQGNAWITSSGNDRLFALDPQGNQLPGSPYKGGGLKKPFGLAVDSLGNVWAANSGMTVPCPSSNIPEGGNGVSLFGPDGKPAQGSPFLGGGLVTPWEVAIDGNDNVWVANFGGKRLSLLCGARPENCPPGYKTGDPISPSTGYSFDGLVRNTGIAIDPSGNVWLANNWLEDVLLQTNPGGDGMVVYIGIAKPIKTPLFGPPQQP